MEKKSKKIQLNLWTAGLVLGFAVIVLGFLFVRNGSFIMDPDEWGVGGRRSYIYVQMPTKFGADQAAKFSFNFPEEVLGYSQKDFWVIENYIYDVKYLDEDGQARIVVHKCKKDDLLEADTNSYPQKNTIDVDGMEVVLQGKNDKIQSISWANKGYYYQILTGENDLMDEESAKALVPQFD